MPTFLGVINWTVGGLTAGVLLAIAVRVREPDVRRGQLLAQIVVACGLIMVLAWRQNPALNLLAPSGFVVAAVPLALLDLRTHRLPNWLVLVTYALTIAGLVIATLARPRFETLLGALAGAVLFLLFYAALYVGLAGQLGGGDVKLSAAAGTVLGSYNWPTVIAGLLFVWLLGAAVFLITRVTGSDQGRQYLPHGPFLVLGTIAALLISP